MMAAATPAETRPEPVQCDYPAHLLRSACTSSPMPAVHRIACIDHEFLTKKADLRTGSCERSRFVNIDNAGRIFDTR